MRPTESQHLGKVLQEPSKVAETIAKAKGASIQVHGAEAARRFEAAVELDLVVADGFANLAGPEVSRALRRAKPETKSGFQTVIRELNLVLK